MQNVAKISPSKSSLVSSPVSSLNAVCALRRCSAASSSAPSKCGARGAELRARALERVEVAATRAERARRLTGDAGRFLEVRDEQVYPDARQRRDVDDRRPLLASRLRRDAGEVDLVRDDRQRAARRVRGPGRRERGRERLAGVGDPEQAIGARDLELRAAHAFALDGIVACRAVPPCRRR